MIKLQQESKRKVPKYEELFAESIDLLAKKSADTEERLRETIRMDGYERTDSRFLLAALLWEGSTVTKKNKKESFTLLRSLSAGGDWRARAVCQTFDPSFGLGHRKSTILTLLFGDLRRNHTTSIGESFFRSRICEVQLLPIIAKYAEALGPPWSWSRVDDDILKVEFASVAAHYVEQVLFMRFQDTSMVTSIQVTNEMCFPLLTMVDTASVKTLSVRDCPISSLEPLANMNLPSLTTLVVRNVSATDLAPLAHLSDHSPLEILLVDCESIRDISLFSQDVSFPHLEKIMLHNLSITDISPMKQLQAPCLHTLSFDGCSKLFNIEPVFEMTAPLLKSLCVSSTSTLDVAPLQRKNTSFRLEFLDLRYTPAADSADDLIRRAVEEAVSGNVLW